MAWRASHQHQGRLATLAAVVAIPISAGEPIDKITILTLKTRRVRNARKRLMAAQELAMLWLAAGPLFGPGETGAVSTLIASLKEVNGALGCRGRLARHGARSGFRPRLHRGGPQGLSPE